MSRTPPSCVTGVWLSRVNAVTSTTSAFDGSETLAGDFGASCTTIGSPPANVAETQLATTVPSDEGTVSPAPPAFFCTGGVDEPVDGAQIVKCVTTAVDWPSAAMEPRITYSPWSVVPGAHVAVRLDASASDVVVPSGRVSVMCVHVTERSAVSENEAREAMVEPSAGVSAIRAGAAATGVTTGTVGGATTAAVLFVTEDVNGATGLPAASCSASSAGTA